MLTVTVGFFPLDERLYLGAHVWSPETVKHIVRQGTEIASYRRAAASFEAMTKIPVSKSSLGRLVEGYGGKIVVQQQSEAEAMVKPPAPDEVITVRDMPRPDSEVMALSMDGAMVNIRGEGWKEVKTVSVSAVGRTVGSQRVCPTTMGRRLPAGIGTSPTDRQCQRWGGLDLADRADVLGALYRNIGLVASGGEIVGSGQQLVC